MTDKRQLWNDDGSPRYLKIYDLPTFHDRFTFVFTGHFRGHLAGKWYFVGASENANWPTGHYTRGELEQSNATAYLGKKVEWSAIPEDLQTLILDEYKSLWRINATPD